MLDDIEQVLKEIPVQQPVVVPVRTEQEAEAAGDLPPLDVDEANVFSQRGHILQATFVSTMSMQPN